MPSPPTRSLLRRARRLIRRLIPPLGTLVFKHQSIHDAPPLAIGRRIAQYCPKQSVPSRQAGKSEEAKPQALPPRWEEALQSFDYVWTQAPEMMKLECGRYDGRKTIFAIGVTFEQAPSR